MNLLKTSFSPYKARIAYSYTDFTRKIFPLKKSIKRPFSLFFIICTLGILNLPAQTQLGSDIDGEHMYDASGVLSISADGTRVAIGSQNNSDSGSSSGHVRVYELNGGVWSQLGADIDGEAATDYSGKSVSLSADGTTVVIGAFANDGTAENSGHSRIYRFDGSNWIQLGADIDGKAIYAWSGFSVGINHDGSLVAIGAPQGGASSVGIYSFDGSNWSQLGADIHYSGIGRHLSFSSDGSTVAIGAPYNSDSASNSGQVRIYQLDGSNNWVQIGSDIFGEAAEDFSGEALSLNYDGTILAIGAKNNDGNGSDSGHVRVYGLDGSNNWVQLGGDIDGEAADDQSGSSVSLSADGTILAIGAQLNDGNGSDSGHARIYKFDGSNWLQLYNDLNGEAANDKFGFSVGLSADGTILAVGAQLNDGNGLNSGHVRVYNFPHPAPGGQATDLAIWLKADGGTYTDTGSTLATSGEQIQLWEDLSSNTNDVSQPINANRPALVTNGLNFNSVVDFDSGSSEYLFNLNGILKGNTYTDVSTYFVARQNTDSSNSYLFYETEGSSQNYSRVLEWTDGNSIANVGNTVNNQLQTSYNGTLGSSDNTYYLWADTHSTTNDGDGSIGQNIRKNALEVFGDETFMSFTGGNNAFSLGEERGVGNYFDGQIAELIIYAANGSFQPQLDKQKIESYLSLKYGITLDQTLATDYLVSNSTVIWDASENTGYGNDIFGIGRDDASGLNQKVSKSINNENGPTLASTQEFIASNQDASRNVSLGDGNFVIMSHNNSANTFTASYDGGSNNRLSRVWKVDETGTVGNIYLAVPYASYTFPSGGTPSIVISNDTTFDESDTSIALTYDRTNGIYWAQINPTDGDYIALATSDITVATPAYYRTSSGGSGGTPTDGITKYLSYADLIADTNGTYFSFTQNWALADNFFSDGVYFYRTNSVINEVIRYPSIADLAANTNGVTYNLSQTWSTNDEFFASGNKFFRTSSSGSGTNGLTTYPSFADMVANTNGVSQSFSEYNFNDQFFHDGQYFLRTNTAGGNHASVARYASLADLASHTRFDTQSFGPWSINDDIFAVGITASYTVSETSLTIAENAGTDTFTVVLDAQPTSDVVFDISSDDTEEATVDKATLTFTTSDWNVAQTVTVTGVNDDIDRDDSATITIAVNDAGSDDTFDALADQSVDITLTDDDTATFMVSETTLAIAEDGGTDTYTVVLDREPTSDVVFDISSDDTNEATVSEAQLTFTNADWDNPQTITVTGVNDDIDRDDSATITVAVNDAGSDDTFDALANQTVAITLTNDDIAAFTVSETTLTIAEDGGTGTYTVVLDSEPTSDVVFDISSSDANEATVDKATLTFTTLDWDTPQTVTVTGIDDDENGNDTATITIAVNVVGSDDAFDILNDQTVTVTLTDVGDNLPVFTAPTSSYDVSTASFVPGQTYNFGANEGNGYGLAFNNDGSKMYVVGRNNDTVYEYNLSTKFDPSTAAYSNEFYVGNEEANPGEVVFNNDGTKMYTTGASSDLVVEYDLTVAFSVSTASHTPGEDLNVLPQVGFSKGISFNNTGSKLFVLDLATKNVFEYDLSVAFDVSTAIYGNKSFNIGGEHSNPQGIAFNDDGTKMFIIGSGNSSLGNQDDTIVEYALSTPFNVTTALYNGDSEELKVGAQDGQPMDVVFDNSGNHVFILGYNNNTVYKYVMQVAISIEENSSAIVTDIDANDGDGGSSDTGIAYSLTAGGDNDFFTIDNTTGELSFQASPDFETALDSNGDNGYEISVVATDSDGNSTLNITVEVTDVDEIAPSGYTVGIDQDPINADNQDSVSFTFASAEVGATYNYTFSSDGGGTNVTGSGTITTTTDQITGIDLSGLGDGTITLSVTLTDIASNVGDAATNTKEKDTTSPSGYTVAIDQDPIDAVSETATSFTFTSAEVGATYNYTFSSDGGGTNVTGSGTITTTTDQITGIDLSALGDGTITLSATLTDTAGNEGAQVTDSKSKDSDADNDGIKDIIDNCPLLANTDQLNTDGDSEGDVCDTDDDNDGTLDVDDAFPLDATEDTDTDGDGTGDNADTDDDNDGTLDVDDAFPLDATEDTDTDGDGTGDNSDTDDDNDGTLDVDDAFPLDASEDTDTDGDGIGDNADTDDDNDGTLDVDDALPLDATENTDTDGDGTGDNADTDDDNDGTLDADDAFPLDATEDTDTDGDGTGDNADTDDDNDGTLDVDDAFPLDPTEDTDTDGDGTGDNADTDDDDDGTPDNDDDFPLDPTKDTDGDSTGDNTDTDGGNTNTGKGEKVISAEAFTPNGDNINDRWIIKNIEEYPNAIVTVYNRYGHVVFKAVNYTNDWNGSFKSNSQKVPPGSYYYTIELGNGKAPLNGWIFINY